MQTCPNCKNENRPGELFCENCGTPLMAGAPAGAGIATRMLEESPASSRDTVPESSPTPAPNNPVPPVPTGSIPLPVLKPPPLLGEVLDSPSTEKISKDATAPVPLPDFSNPQSTAELGMPLTFEIGEEAPPIEVNLKEVLVFGRKDAPTGTLPDVDLSNLAGYRMGVSRKHAEIRYNASDKSLELWDLGSSNGTFINGDRLVAHRAYRLGAGDQVRFGQLLLTLRFGSSQPKVAEEPIP